MLKIDFKEEKIADLMSEGGFVLTDESKMYLSNYYVKNYSTVCRNITDDELVGYAYENLCTIERLVPEVKQFKKQLQ